MPALDSKAMPEKQQIFALGGGGFDSDNPTPALDRYFLELTGKERPKLCFVSTATGDSQFRIARFFKSASTQNCETSVLELYRPPSRDLEAWVLEHDAVFVGGGNTRCMLALWREWELDKALKTACTAGVVLGGVSAGANCWFEECSTDSNFGELSVMSCMGWLMGSFCPHFDAEEERRPTLERFLSSGEIGPGLAADEHVGVLYHGTEMIEAVSDKDGAKLWRADREAIEPMATRVIRSA